MAGQWTFMDDGTVIDFSSCPDMSENACGTIVQLPRRADRQGVQRRETLCGADLIVGLVPRKAASGASRLTGWIADPDTLLDEKGASRYPVDIRLESAHRALMEVRGPLGLVAERYTLVRRIAPVRRCE